LLERAVTRYTPAIQDFEEEWSLAVGNLLSIFQDYGTEQRTNRILGSGNTWEVEQFSASDIAGSIDIRVEAGSSAPKNSVGIQATIQDLAALGVINPANPETQYRILEEFGMTRLLGGVDDNLKQAQREEWRFFENQPPKMPGIMMGVDDHAVHIMSHRQRALKSDFETLPQQVQAIWLQHIAEHEMMIAAAAAPPPGEEEAAGEAPGGSATSATTPADASYGQPGTPPGMPPLPPDMSPETQLDSQMPPLFPGAL
jgi:hypothetical protein